MISCSDISSAGWSAPDDHARTGKFLASARQASDMLNGALISMHD
jgi:hypothetical protein